MVRERVPGTCESELINTAISFQSELTRLRHMTQEQTFSDPHTRASKQYDHPSTSSHSANISQEQSNLNI